MATSSATLKKHKLIVKEKKSFENYLKPVDQILARFKYDEKLQTLQDEIIIGYKDRFVGIMETTIREYEMSDIVQHRIYYLQIRGVKVWDRDSRFDAISTGKWQSLLNIAVQSTAQAA